MSEQSTRCHTWVANTTAGIRTSHPPAEDTPQMSPPRRITITCHPAFPAPSWTAAQARAGFQHTCDTPPLSPTPSLQYPTTSLSLEINASFQLLHGILPAQSGILPLSLSPAARQDVWWDISSHLHPGANQQGGSKASWCASSHLSCSIRNTTYGKSRGFSTWVLFAEWPLTFTRPVVSHFAS